MVGLNLTGSGQGKWLAVLALLGVFATSAWAEDQRVTFANASVTWKLTSVLKTGAAQVMQSKEGTLKRQYVIGADADAGTQALFPKAHLRLTIDVFSPVKNMPGQVKGKWYVHGTWTLEPDVQTGASTEAGALTGPLSGRVQAELPFDPTATNKKWKGAVLIPMRRVRADNVSAGVRPLRGEGEIVFDTDGTGSLTVNLKLWPKL